MVNMRILLSLLLVTPLVVVIGIYASHRIAGPIYRIEKFLNDMASGKFSNQLVLRKNDELISLANGINRVVESIKMTVRQEREHLAKTAVSLDSVRRIVQSKSVDHSILENTIEKLSEELNKAARELDKYKV
jgi:signal transduction histidine kinase